MVQSQNDLKYEMFHNILAPSSIKNLKLKCFIRKLIIETFHSAGVPQGTQASEGTISQFWTAQAKSYRLPELSTIPESNIIRVILLNLSKS